MKESTVNINHLLQKCTLLKCTFFLFVCVCVYSSAWQGGPKAVKTKTWRGYLNVFLALFFVRGGLLPGEVTTLRLKYVCACLRVCVWMCVCARQTVFSHAKGQQRYEKQKKIVSDREEQGQNWRD